MAVLFRDLSPVDAAAALEELARRDVRVELGGGGRTIAVPAAERDALRRELLAAGIPADGRGGAGPRDPGPAALQAAGGDGGGRGTLESELAKSLETLQGIRSARVHLLATEAGALPGDGSPATASVVLRLDGQTRLGEARIRGIQTLVAGAVANLAPPDVTVLDQQGKVLSAQRAAVEPGHGAQRLAARKEVEGYLADKATSMLDRVLGVGRSVVRVDATLDFAQTEREREIFDPAASVVRNESRSESSGPQEGATEQSETTYEINRTVERIVGETGGIASLSVAVFVDGHYEAAEAEADPVYRPLAEAELAQLRRVVATAVGLDTSRGDRIEVVNMPFQWAGDKTVKGSPGPHWFIPVTRYGSRVLLVVAMAVIVFALRRNLGRLTGAPRGTETPPLRAAARRADHDLEQFAGIPEMNQQVVQDIQDYAADNPERVAEVIQAWIQDIDLETDTREKVGG
jgi:flagellar M-ring protein FliF